MYIKADSLHDERDIVFIDNKMDLLVEKVLLFDARESGGISGIIVI